MTHNEQLSVRGARVLPRGNSRATLYVPPSPPYAARGEGAFVTDVDGHRLIDCNNNYTSLIHGHAHPVVVAAAVEAVGRGSAFGLPVEGEIALAELLTTRFGRPMQWRFANSGSEAVMMALRAVRAFTGRDLVVRIAGAYHGTYDQVVAPDEPGVPSEVRAATIAVPQDDEDAVVDVFATRGERIAAILVDLMPNRAGLQPLKESFVEALRREAAAAGALVVADEVITFRLGPAGLQEAYGLEPDLTVLAKIIGGGFPVGAVGGRPEVMGCFDPERPTPIHWGGTFNANPVTMAAGRAAMELFDAPAIRALNRRGDTLRAAFVDAGMAVTGSGSLMRLLADDPAKAWWELYGRGVLVSGNGLMALSTAMSDEDLEAVRSAVVSVLG
jgi:glutamate-1-semialdehyde 2,1-aminomutase